MSRIIFYLIFALLASSNSKFAIGPADGRAFFEYQAEAGDVISDKATLANLADTSAEFRVWRADGRTTNDGNWNLDLGPLADWITWEASEVEVPAGYAVELPFTIHVPAGQPDGQYLLGLMAEPIENQTEGSVAVIRRSGVAISLTVGSPSDCNIRIDGIDFDQNGVRARVQLPISNLGNVHFKGTGVISLGGWEQPVKLPFVVAGDTFEYRLGVPTLPPGKYFLGASLQSSEYPKCSARIEAEVMVLPDTLPPMGGPPPVEAPAIESTLPERLRLTVESPNGQLVDILVYVAWGAVSGLGVTLAFAVWIRRKSKPKCLGHPTRAKILPKKGGDFIE